MDDMGNKKNLTRFSKNISLVIYPKIKLFCYFIGKFCVFLSEVYAQCSFSHRTNSMTDFTSASSVKMIYELVSILTVGTGQRKYELMELLQQRL